MSVFFATAWWTGSPAPVTKTIVGNMTYDSGQAARLLLQDPHRRSYHLNGKY